MHLCIFLWMEYKKNISKQVVKCIYDYQSLFQYDFLFNVECIQNLNLIDYKKPVCAYAKTNFLFPTKNYINNLTFNFQVLGVRIKKKN